jgi:hypothetical protein
LIHYIEDTVQYFASNSILVPEKISLRSRLFFGGGLAGGKIRAGDVVLDDAMLMCKLYSLSNISAISRR